MTGVPRTTVRDWRSGRLPRLYQQDPSVPTAARAGACSTCGRPEHDFALLPDVYAYLLGLYLGDGSIARHPRNVYKLRVFLDAAYPGIISECIRAMEEVLPSSKVNTWRRQGDVEVYAYSKSWPCLFPQHGPGAKHRRQIVLARWQSEIVRRAPRLLLRGLIHSDGCRFQNTGRRWSHPRYSFTNHSSDIRRIFCETCDELGLRWTVSGRIVYVSRIKDVAILDEFIGAKA